MARPTKFNRDVIDRLLRAIRMGASYESACRYAGIHYDTFNNWRNGKFPRGLDDDQKQLKVEFFERLTRAEGDASVRALSTIMQAIAQGDAKIAMDLLSRRWPEEYGMKRVELTGKNSAPVQINHVQQKVQELASRVAFEMGIEEYGEDLVKTVMAHITGDEQGDGKQ